MPSILRPRTLLLAIIVLGSAIAVLREPSMAGRSIETKVVASGLKNPWGLAFLPDGRMLVTERPGTLRIVETDGRLGKPVTGVPKVFAVAQGGLLDVALDPEFTSNRVIYLSYSEPDGDMAATAVYRATLGDGVLTDGKVIFRQEPKAPGGIHFGSRFAFAPDGRLFVTLGDRNEDRDKVQQLSTLRGKVVRLERDGSIPSDNPFVGRSDARGEIWSYGHRNVQGAAIHPVTGVLWTHEHGPQGGDEINITRPGRNFGWPVITYGEEYGGGTIGIGTKKEGMDQPVHIWVPSIAPCGMVFYTGDRYPGWQGNLFVGSLKFGFIARLSVQGDKVIEEERLAVPGFRIRDVRQGPDGYLYYLTDEVDGKIVRIVG